MTRIEKDYYVGLDMGTNSVGWAVTDTDYNIQKFRNKRMWGSRLFDTAQTAAERRSFRTARRRSHRRKERINILESLFTKEIAPVDPNFYLRLRESKFYPEDKDELLGGSRYALFSDKNYNDSDYFRDYPTISHLRLALINNNGESKPDIRLYYLAIHQMMKNRGHFLFGQKKFEISAGYQDAFSRLIEAAEDLLEFPVTDDSFVQSVHEILTNSTYGVQKKAAELNGLLSNPDKRIKELFRLLAGGKTSLDRVFDDESLADLPKLSFRESSYEDNESQYEQALEDRMELIEAVKGLYDLVVLEGLLGSHTYISEARVEVFEKHKSDLTILKRVLKNPPICDPQEARTFFNAVDKNDNYPAYIGSCYKRGKKVPRTGKRAQPEDLYRVIRKLLGPAFEKLNDGQPIAYAEDLSYIQKEIDNGTFLPKQVNSANGVIPYQLHLMELDRILTNLQRDYPSFSVKGADGYSPAEKIRMTFTFRIPYYVGPLNDLHAGDKGSNVWIAKKDNIKITPWNFEDIVDQEKSAERFIRRMTNKCTYLLKEDVLPKNSLLYQSYMVLNELNNLKIDGTGISVELKQRIYHDVFEGNVISGKITKKKLKDWLVREANVAKGAVITGIDDDFKSSLSTFRTFQDILGDRIFKKSVQSAVEDIVKDITLFGDDRSLLYKRLNQHYHDGGTFSDSEIKRFSRLRFKDWGRLSEKLLNGIAAQMPELLGKETTIIGALWNTNLNLMQILANKYEFIHEIEKENDVLTVLNGKVDYETIAELPISPAVCRSLWQTLQIVQELRKIQGHDPKRIFIEVAREEGEKKRTESRKKQIENLYKEAKDIAPRLQEELKQFSDSDLQGRLLYLYFTQLGKDMYTGDEIDLSKLFDNNLYDKDHIYPRSLTKDDSLANNLVLVNQRDNRTKSNTYPLSRYIQNTMRSYWSMLLSKHLITQEKFDRLTRTEDLTSDELAKFINRQLVETRQSSKAAADILSKMFPNTDIVYVKAGNVSDFRQKFDLVKVREVNDLHHAKDAYLNIVVGNVYFNKFTKNPALFIKSKSGERYPYNLYKLFDHDVSGPDGIVWKEGNSIATVKKWMRKNNPLVTRYTAIVRGGFYDQNPVKKTGSDVKKQVGKLPLNQKDNRLTVAKYGGFNKVKIAYFSLVESTIKKQRMLSIESVPLLIADQYRADPNKQKLFLTHNCGLKDPEVKIPVLKKNTLIKVDGCPLYVTGKSNVQIVVENGVQLVLPEQQEAYTKEILKFNERQKAAKNKLKIGKYSQITAAANIELYDTLLRKEASTIYLKCPSNQAATLQKGRNRFFKLTLEEQTAVLGEILHLFQSNSVTSNLKSIGGKEKVGLSRINKNLGNKKVRVYYQSVTGLYEQELIL